MFIDFCDLSSFCAEIPGGELEGLTLYGLVWLWSSGCQMSNIQRWMISVLEAYMDLTFFSILIILSSDSGSLRSFSWFLSKIS